jgi:hypothetical protein
MKLHPIKSTASILLALVFTASLATAVEIEDVMKNAMKGESSLYKNVATGKGSQSDADKLLGYLKGLQGTKAPKGEQSAYDGKVSKLVKASEGVSKKEPGSLQKLQTAGNCKACHSAHRES